MTENVPNFDGRMKKEDAINEAVFQQFFLYDWQSNHLRSSKRFDKSDYEAAEKRLEYYREIQKQIRALPAEGHQRTIKVIELTAHFGITDFIDAWRVLIDDDTQFSPRVEKFIANSALIFAGAEKDYFDFSGDGDATYSAPSHRGVVLTSKLYEKISGRDYDSPEELREYFMQAVQGKKVLELAPGPGWQMKVLKDLGADVSGIEKSEENNFVASAWGLDIKFADASYANQLFSAEFDIVCSNNFLSQHIAKDYGFSLRALKNSNDVLKPGGAAVHCIHRPRLPKELRCLIEGPVDSHAFLHLLGKLESLPAEERELALYPAQPGLLRPDLESVGNNIDYSQADNFFTMAYYKT